MKTKTNSLTKVINFCVIALFFISTLIFFTSCDNGNSPNDNINQQQNNNSQTDYCEICDGLQTENCGIKHKCDDENCVEYSANKIYKNGHTHDYCEKTDCDGSTHMGADHPTTQDNCDYCGDELSDNTCVDGSECYAGGKVITIGDNYKIFDAMNEDYFNNYNEQTKIDSLNLYKTRYEKYVNELINSFSKDFKTKYNITNINFRKFVSGLNNNNEVDPKYAIFDNEIEQINNVCAPVFEEIAKNTNEDLYKKMLYQYYRAYTNEADKLGYSIDYFSGSDAEIQYNAMKNTIKNTSFNKNYPIYETITKDDGTTEEVISKSASENLTAVLTKAANEMSVDVTDLQRIFNLSLSTNTLNSLHKSTATQTEHTVNNCPSNTILESVILPNISLNNYSTITPTSIHQDFGRELC